MGATPAPFNKEGSPRSKGEDPAQQVTIRTGRRPFVKGVLLVIFIVAAIAVVRFTPIKSFLTPAGLGRFLERTAFPQVFFSVALFVFSFFIPRIIKKIKGE